MINSSHFKRLEHLYTASASGTAEPDGVAVAFGRAQLNAQLEASQREASTLDARSVHHRLLSDVAALAAGSLVKDRMVSVERFNVQMLKPEYQGPVVASSQVVAAQHPRFIVGAILTTPGGEFVARATGVYGPSHVELPPDPAPEDAEARHPAEEADTKLHPAPAMFMSVFPTQFGSLCLN